MTAPRNFHEAAVADFRKFALARLRREAEGGWFSTGTGRWYEPPNKRLRNPSVMAAEADEMVKDFIHNGYRYPHYQLPEDIRYFNIYHRWQKEYDDVPTKRRSYDY